jgi:MFS family permease
MSTTTETVALSTFSQKPTILEPHSQEASTRASINAEPLSSAPPSDEQNIALARTTDPKASQLRIALTIFQPSLINFFSSFTNGLITVGLPVIARSIDLPRELYLWPSSVYGLTSGAMLLIAGAIADIVGARNVEMVGVTLLGIFTLACGFSETGIQLVVFRALQGVAMAMHLPASVSIIAAAVPVGRARNVAFACLGLSAPLGFSLGLVLSGILIERTTWRTGFYISGAASLAAAVVAYWSLPKVQTAVAGGSTPMWRRVWTEVDWIGGFVASAGLAILAYVLA